MSPFPANLADASDLIRWADRLDSQSGLPRLIRRLILGSVAGMRQVSFRADEGVQLAGWDGVTVSDQAHPHVPQGLAGWELSARKDVKTNADEDYANLVELRDKQCPREVLQRRRRATRRTLRDVVRQLEGYKESRNANNASWSD
jgi:hypothetical protein